MSMLSSDSYQDQDTATLLKRSRNLVGPHPDSDLNIQVLDRLIELSERGLVNRDPDQRLYDVRTILDVPSTADPLKLALCDLDACLGIGDSAEIQCIVRHPEGRIQHLETIPRSKVWASLARAGTSSAKSFPAVTLPNLRATPDGLGQFRFRIPSDFGPFYGRTIQGDLEDNPTELSSTFITQGWHTSVHIDYYGAHAVTAHLSGHKIWLTWPPTVHNLTVMHEVISYDLEYPVLQAIDDLENLSVLIVEKPVAWIQPPFTIHAVLTLGPSVHSGGPVWQLSSLNNTLATLSKIYDLVSIDQDKQLADLNPFAMLDHGAETLDVTDRLMGVAEKIPELTEWTPQLREAHSNLTRTHERIIQIAKR